MALHPRRRRAAATAGAEVAAAVPGRVSRDAASARRSTPSTGRSAPAWCPSAAGRCRWPTRAGTIEEHLACRQRRGGVRRQPPRHRPGRGRGRARRAAGGSSPTTSARSARAGRSTPTCSTRTTPRCSTTSSCGGVADERVRRDAQRLQHRAGRGPPIGGEDVTDRAGRSSPCRAPRPAGGWRRWRPRPPRSAGSASRRFDVAGRAVHRRRHRLHRRGRRRDRGARPRPRPRSGGRCWPPAWRPAGLGARDTLRLEAAPAAARPRARPRHHPAAGRAGLGGGVDEAGRSAAGTRWRPSGSAGVTGCLRGIATEGRRPPRAECPVRIDGAAVGGDDQRQLLARARPRHRARLPAARRSRRATAVEIDLRGAACGDGGEHPLRPQGRPDGHPTRRRSEHLVADSATGLREKPA